MKKKPLSTPTSQDKVIVSLIESLASKRPAVREKSRKQLVDIGHASVIPLLHKLKDPVEHVRWEAAKALDAIGDPAAADALVEALDDASDDVRWVAGEALIGLGWEAVKQVLISLLRNADSNGMCAGAHHVLSNFAKRKSGQFLKPVVDRLQGYEPGVSVPPAALTALKSLRKSRPSR
jgi:HEAT repeat protein